MKDDVDDEDEAPNIRKKGRRAQRKAKNGVVLRRTFSPRFLEDCDTRLAVVRLLRNRVQVLMQDAGGDESEQRGLLCKRAAFLSIVLETMECDALESGAFDIGTFTQSLNALNGCLKSLGLERRVKRAGLQVYLAEKEKQA